MLSMNVIDPQTAKATDKFRNAMEKAVENFIAEVLQTKPAAAITPLVVPAYDSHWKNPNDSLSASGREAIAKAYAEGWDAATIERVFKISKTAVGRNRVRWERGRLYPKPRKAELVRDIILAQKKSAGNAPEAQVKENCINEIVAKKIMPRQLARGYVKANWPKVSTVRRYVRDRA